MYVPIRTDRKCHDCVFFTRPYCYIRERFGGLGPPNRAATVVCRNLLMQRGVPQYQLPSYNWQEAPGHPTMED